MLKHHNSLSLLIMSGIMRLFLLLVLVFIHIASSIRSSLTLLIHSFIFSGLDWCLITLIFNLLV